MSSFILNDQNAMYFECGYGCDNGLFLNLKGDEFFITDGRYASEAQENINSNCLVICSNDLIKEARLLLRKKNIKSIIIDPYDFNLANFERLSSNLNIRFVRKNNFSRQRRICKNQLEIDNLKKAAQAGRDCFDEFAKFLNENGEGLSEKELFFKARQIFSSKLELSFDPIFAINENAAKAHALPSDKYLKKGDLILLDAGVKFNSFCSDRTRTACFKDNFNFDLEQKFENKKQQEIYDIVKQAQLNAIKAVEIGKKASDIDAISREYITSQGYGQYFIHSTGHGVGLDIHELPYISKRDDTILKEGMVFSIEPGIYIPNEFGVRIEDVVVVSKNGAEVL